MNLDAGRAMLHSAHKTLQAKWDAAEQCWQDEQRRLFEEQVGGPLRQMVGVVLQAVDQMQVQLHQMKRECEGSGVDLNGSD